MIYKILKNNSSGVKRKTIERVFNFLKEIDNQVEEKKFTGLKKTKIQESDTLHSKNISVKIDELIDIVTSESEKIKEVNQKIDILFDIVRAGSQQLTMSLVDNQEIKSKIEVLNDTLTKKTASLSNQITNLSNQGTKNL